MLRDIYDRITKRLEAVGLSANAASLKAGLSEDAIRNIKRAVETGRESGLSTQTILKLAPVLRTTASWLLEGVGTEEFDPNNGEVIDLKAERVRPRLLVTSFDPDHPDTAGAFGNAEDTAEMTGYTREHWEPRIDGALPEIDVKLGAGHGTVGNTIALPASEGAITGHRVVAEWLIPLDYLRSEVKAAPNQTIVLEVIGDSMAPTYMPGDRVLVDLSQDHLITDTVYAISYDHGEPQIKRLQRIPFSNPPRVKIISDNPNLETFEVDLSQLTIIGRICGRISRA